MIHADTITRHIGLFQIPFLGSSPLSIDGKISLITSAKYMISDQSDTETDSSSRYRFVRFGFK